MALLFESPQSEELMGLMRPMGTYARHGTYRLMAPMSPLRHTGPISFRLWLVRSAFVESRVQKLARFTSNPA